MSTDCPMDPPDNTNFMNFFQDGALPDFGLLDSPKAGVAGGEGGGPGPSSCGIKSKQEQDDGFSSGDDGEDADAKGGAGAKRKREGKQKAAHTKASREKGRRMKINERFTDLAKLIDPGGEVKTDKYAILTDAIKYLKAVQSEHSQLKQLNKFLEERVGRQEKDRGQQLYQQSLVIQQQQQQQHQQHSLQQQQQQHMMSNSHPSSQQQYGHSGGLMMQQQQHSSMQPSLMPHGGMHRPSMSHHHSNNPLQMHTQLSQMMQSQHQQPHQSHHQQQPPLLASTSDMYHIPINSSIGDSFGSSPQDVPHNNNSLPHQTSQPLVDAAGIQVAVGELQAWNAGSDLGQQHEPLSLSLAMMSHQPKHLMLDGGSSGGGAGMLAYPPAGYSWVPAAMLDSRQDSLLRPPAA